MLTGARLTSRVERLVAAGRLVLAASALVAIYLDPAEPSRFAALTYGLLALYTAYAAGVVLVVWPRVTQPYAWSIATHVVDVSFFALLLYLTEGPSSPFFVYFVFACFSAALRLGIGATIWTAAGAVVVYVALGLYVSVFVRDSSFELNRFLVRGAYLCVIGMLLTYFASYQKAIAGELGALATWPRRVQRGIEALVKESLENAAKLVRVRRVFLAWHDGAYARLYQGEASDSGFEIHEEVGDFAEPLLSGVCPRSLILRHDLGKTFTRSAAGEVAPADREIVDAEFRSAFDLQAGLVAWFSEERVRGAVIFADRRDVAIEDIALAEIVATIIGSKLEQYIDVQRGERAAAAEARMKLARDVHDSVLQSLTGTALQLEVLKRTTERDPAAARQLATELQEFVSAEQRELRTFVHRLQTDPPVTVDTLELEERLQSLAARVRKQWDLDVRIAVDPLTSLLSAGVKHEVYSIVGEAVLNAAKHAGATLVDARIALEIGEVVIHVSDDGRGFAFAGEYDLASLSTLRRGPVMLKERVASLGGALRISSSPSGAKVFVSLPLAESGGADVHPDRDR